MSEPVEVVIARNGKLGPLHLAIPVGAHRWLAACRRIVDAPVVDTWGPRDPVCPWGEIRTCPDCEGLGEKARDTVHLAQLAGWSTPRSGGSQHPRPTASRTRH